jgi:hypothetical protein
MITVSFPPEMKHCIFYVRGENGTYTAMLDTGIAVSSISRVQFITGQGSIQLYEN